MWIRTIKLRLSLWLYQRTKETLTSQQQRQLTLELFDPALFTHQDLGFDCAYDLDVLLPNLVAYVRMVNDLILVLEKQEKIDISSYSLDTCKVTVERFFMSDARLYLDREKHLKLFVSRLQVLVASYEAIEKERVGIAGFNGRILTKVIRSLMELVEQLRKYSLT